VPEQDPAGSANIEEASTSKRGKNMARRARPFRGKVVYILERPKIKNRSKLYFENFDDCNCSGLRTNPFRRGGRGGGPDGGGGSGGGDAMEVG